MIYISFSSKFLKKGIEKPTITMDHKLMNKHENKNQLIIINITMYEEYNISESMAGAIHVSNFINQHC